MSELLVVIDCLQRACLLMQGQQSERYQYSMEGPGPEPRSPTRADEWSIAEAYRWRDGSSRYSTNEQFQYALLDAFDALDFFCGQDDVHFYKEFKLQSKNVADVMDLLSEVYRLCDEMPEQVYTEETLSSRFNPSYIADKTRSYKKMFTRYSALEANPPPEIARLKNFE